MNGANPYYTDEQINQYPPVSNPYELNSQPNYFSNQPPHYPNPNPPQYYQQPLYPPYSPNNPNRALSPRESPNVIIIDMQNPPPPGQNLTACHYCRQNTVSYVQLKSGAFVWLMCFIIMLLTICCWWIAFWIDEFKDKVYRCSKCNNIKKIKEGGC